MDWGRKLCKFFSYWKMSRIKTTSNIEMPLLIAQWYVHIGRHPISPSGRPPSPPHALAVRSRNIIFPKQPFIYRAAPRQVSFPESMHPTTCRLKAVTSTRWKKTLFMWTKKYKIPVAFIWRRCSTGFLYKFDLQESAGTALYRNINLLIWRSVGCGWSILGGLKRDYLVGIPWWYIKLFCFQFSKDILIINIYIFWCR